MKHKLTVITDEKNRVVATQTGHGDVRHPATGVLARILPGPWTAASQDRVRSSEAELAHRN